MTCSPCTQRPTTPEGQFRLSRACEIGLHGAPTDEARALFRIERTARQQRPGRAVPG